MRLDDVVVLPANLTGDVARRRLETRRPRDRVVVRLEWRGQTSFYAFVVQDILPLVGSGDATLAEALGLLEMQPTPVLDLEEDAHPSPRRLSVLVQDDDVVGVFVPE